MSDNIKTSFLTYYIQSLGERTRDEKRGTKFGFDWVIYNICLTEGWTPHRLPFLRTGPDEISTTKTEPEFGIDLAFLSPDRKTLRIFALKDEVLNNRNWGKHSFNIDLRNAAAPDLTGAGMNAVESVEVILAYNKDEDRTGITLFDNLARSVGSRVGDHVALSFDRWNLTSIVEKVQETLLAPSLLPQKFFSHFSYICAQFADFQHGSDEWTNQMVPNWRRFLQELLSEKADERCIRLLPVALLILQKHGKDNPTTETAWIDLIEWGMLAIWEVARNSTSKKIKAAVFQVWISFYIAELERYYKNNSDSLAIHFSLDKPRSSTLVDTIASAVVAHWHIARLGTLGLAYSECLPQDTQDNTEHREEALLAVSNWMIGLLNGNPSSLRPLIDIHQIELFLTWCTLLQLNRLNDAHKWLVELTNRLFMRRSGHAQIPFIEGRNSIDLVFEHVATGEKPHEFCDTSSVYLMCLMELMCALPSDQIDKLLSTIHRRLVLGKTDDGNQIDGCEAIDLMSWVPPEDWNERVLTQSLADKGECITVNFSNISEEPPTAGEEIRATIQALVSETRTKRTFKYPEDLPLSVIVLACLKHQSPLPPEIWRQSIFPESSDGVLSD